MLSPPTSTRSDRSASNRTVPVPVRSVRRRRSVRLSSRRARTAARPPTARRATGRRRSRPRGAHGKPARARPQESPPRSRAPPAVDRTARTAGAPRPVPGAAGRERREDGVLDRLEEIAERGERELGLRLARPSHEHRRSPPARDVDADLPQRGLSEARAARENEGPCGRPLRIQERVQARELGLATDAAVPIVLSLPRRHPRRRHSRPREHSRQLCR